MKQTGDLFRKLQLALAYFIATGAGVGCLMMWQDPTGVHYGMDVLLAQLREAFPFAASLFTDLYPSAVALLLVNGLPNLLSIYLLHRHHSGASGSTLTCGLLLLGWILVEFYAWGFNGMSVAFALLAGCQIALSAKIR